MPVDEELAQYIVAGKWRWIGTLHNIYRPTVSPVYCIAGNSFRYIPQYISNVYR